MFLKEKYKLSKIHSFLGFLGNLKDFWSILGMGLTTLGQKSKLKKKKIPNKISAKSYLVWAL